MAVSSLPVGFRSGGGGINPSYDWYDYQAGVGFKKFYLGAGYTGVAGESSYYITPQTNATRYTPYLLQSGAGNVEYNFDIQFAHYETVEGTALLEWTQNYQNGTTGNIAIVIYHVNLAAAETQIGALTVTGITNKVYRMSGDAALTTKTFIPGEKLRISVTLTNTGINGLYLYIDPSSRTTVTESDTAASIRTDFAIHVPFRIER